MSNLLEDWFDISRKDFESKGFTIAITSGHYNSSTSINIDCHKFVGTICYWKPNRFEFQFNDCNTGEMIILETVELYTLNSITQYYESIMLKLKTKGSD